MLPHDYFVSSSGVTAAHVLVQDGYKDTAESIVRGVLQGGGRVSDLVLGCSALEKPSVLRRLNDIAARVENPQSDQDNVQPQPQSPPRTALPPELMRALQRQMQQLFQRNPPNAPTPRVYHALQTVEDHRRHPKRQLGFRPQKPKIAPSRTVAPAPPMPNPTREVDTRTFAERCADIFKEDERAREHERQALLNRSVLSSCRSATAPTPTTETATQRNRLSEADFIAGPFFAGPKEGYYFGVHKGKLGYHLDPCRQIRFIKQNATKEPVGMHKKIKEQMEAIAETNREAKALQEAERRQEANKQKALTFMKSVVKKEGQDEEVPRFVPPGWVQDIPRTSLLIGERMCIRLGMGRPDDLSFVDQWLQSTVPDKVSPTFIDPLTRAIMQCPVSIMLTKANFDAATLRSIMDHKLSGASWGSEELDNRAEDCFTGLYTCGIFSDIGELKYDLSTVQHGPVQQNPVLRKVIRLWREQVVVDTAREQRIAHDADEIADWAIHLILQRTHSVAELNVLSTAYGGGNVVAFPHAIAYCKWEEQKKEFFESDPLWSDRDDRRKYRARHSTVQQQKMHDIETMVLPLQKLSEVCLTCLPQDPCLGKRKVCHIVAMARCVFQIDAALPDYAVVLQAKDLFLRAEQMLSSLRSISSLGLVVENDPESDSDGSYLSDSCVSSTDLEGGSPKVDSLLSRRPQRFYPHPTSPGAPTPAMHEWRAKRKEETYQLACSQEMRSRAGRPTWYEKRGVTVPAKGDSPFDRAHHIVPFERSPPSPSAMPYAAAVLLMHSGWEGYPPQEAPRISPTLPPTAALVLVVYSSLRNQPSFQALSVPLKVSFETPLQITHFAGGNEEDNFLQGRQLRGLVLPVPKGVLGSSGGRPTVVPPRRQRDEAKEREADVGSIGADGWTIKMVGGQQRHPPVPPKGKGRKSRRGTKALPVLAKRVKVSSIPPAPRGECLQKGMISAQGDVLVLQPLVC